MRPVGVKTSVFCAHLVYKLFGGLVLLRLLFRTARTARMPTFSDIFRTENETPFFHVSTMALPL